MVVEEVAEEAYRNKMEAANIWAEVTAEVGGIRGGGGGGEYLGGGDGGDGRGGGGGGLRLAASKILPSLEKSFEINDSFNNLSASPKGTDKTAP